MEKKNQENNRKTRKKIIATLLTRKYKREPKPWRLNYKKNRQRKVNMEKGSER